MSEVLEKVKNIVKIEKAEVTVGDVQVATYSLPYLTFPVTLGDMKAQLRLEPYYELGRYGGGNNITLPGPGKFRIWLIVEKVEESSGEKK